MYAVSLKYIGERCFIPMNVHNELFNGVPCSSAQVASPFACRFNIFYIYQATTEMRMVRWAMGVSLLEHQRNEEILEEAKVEPIETGYEMEKAGMVRAHQKKT